MNSVYIGLFIGLVVFLGIFLGMYLARAAEKGKWNSGICAETGTSWVRFDVDSQGGRGYKADGHLVREHCVWINYSGIDRDYREKEDA